MEALPKPCPLCSAAVVLRKDGTQDCSHCTWRWLPPSKRQIIVRNPALETKVCQP